MRSLYRLFLILMLPCCLLGKARAELVLRAAEHGLVPGSHEAGDALRALIDKAKQAGEPCTIELQKGEYHFYAQNDPVYELYISNHDQQPERPVGIPLVGMNGFSIKSDGAEFVFHGRQLPLLVMDSMDTKLEGISIRYVTSFSSEGRIVAQDETSTTVEINPNSPRWCVEEGKFFNYGNGWKNRILAAIAFLPDGRMVPTGKAGDIEWTAKARQLSSTRVSFAINTLKLGLDVGQTLILRSYRRPNPAIFLYRAEGTTLNNVIIHDSMGMGILGQRSKDITIQGGGVIRLANRYGTTGADATHFSNCRGHISVNGALFEGMMDDAINVHATCLGVTEVISPTEIKASYMHPQAIGFEVVQAGERVRFIHGRTLENNPAICRVKSVRQPAPDTVIISFEENIPQGIGEGDALENADWHPSVTFAHNTVRHNRARGTLFTTPEPVLVEHNQFLWSSGSAILLAGDAQGWYESGSCTDVTIRGNVFDHCLTSLFQFTDAIISICPEVKQPDAQKERYHRNIRIQGNVFRTHRVPLLSAISADDVTFSDNKIIYDEAAPTLFGGEPYRLRHCGKLNLQSVTPPAP